MVFKHLLRTTTTTVKEKQQQQQKKEHKSPHELWLNAQQAVIHSVIQSVERALRPL